MSSVKNVCIYCLYMYVSYDATWWLIPGFLRVEGRMYILTNGALLIALGNTTKVLSVIRVLFKGVGKDIHLTFVSGI